MGRHREDDCEPVIVPPRKRYRRVWTHQPTYPFYGILLAALLMFDGVQLFDQLQYYTHPRASAVRHPMRSHEKNSSYTNGGPSPNGGYRAAEDCKTHECAILTSERLPMMDLSVDPCDDFYRYACGKFANDTESRDGRNTATTAFTKVHDVLESQLLATVSERIYPDELLPFRAVKKLYNLCMNTAKIDEQGFKPLLDNLNKFGGWPVLATDGKWTKEETSRSWTKAMKTLRTLGYSNDYFFDVSVGVDWKNRSRRVIYLDQPSLGISREDLVQGENNTNVQAYFDSMVNLTVSLGAKRDRAVSVLQEALDFEMFMAQFTLPRENRRNATAMYNEMSLEKFHSKYPYTDWVAFFNAMFNHTSIAIDKDEIIIVRAPTFMDQLFPLLETTSKRSIGNYVMWRVLKSSSSFLPKTLTGQDPELSPEQEQIHRAKECVDIISQRLPIAVGALYARNYFDEESRREALDMVNDTKNAFLNILNSVDWMDATTRTAALNRMKSMTFQVGYPVEVMDDTKINEYYEGLESVELENSYLNTILYIDRFLTTKKFKKLREPVNVTDWTTHSSPTGVYPHYAFFENSVHIPAHYFQAPFYSFYWPNYMNYGAIGAVIGRAVTHGFDDLGRHFDTIDSPSDWCPTSAGKAFLEQAFCITKQDKFSGYDTISAKIADAGGIRVAYKAYKNWAALYGPDPVVAGLGQQPEHLFWLSAAQTWCSRYGPKLTGMRISLGATAPDRYRVLEPLRNLDEFSKDFECPPGSPMNPAKKCKVW